MIETPLGEALQTQNEIRDFVHKCELSRAENLTVLQKQEEFQVFFAFARFLITGGSGAYLVFSKPDLWIIAGMLLAVAVVDLALWVEFSCWGKNADYLRARLLLERTLQNIAVDLRRKTGEAAGRMALGNRNMMLEDLKSRFSGLKEVLAVFERLN